MTHLFKPYVQLMRWNKPIGHLLLLWPTLAALWLANHGMPSWQLLAIFTSGVFIMRSAGCVVNDIADHRFDRYVARTQQRPLASGAIPLYHAWLVFLILISIALLLVLQLNWLTVALAPWVLLLVIFYPFSKRFTYWPQAILGLTFYTSILMAFTAVQQTIPWIAIWFYISAVLWAIAYDTQYAMTDSEDDKKIAIRSTALLFGDHARRCIVGLQIAVLLMWSVMGFLIEAGWPYIVALCGIVMCLCYQYYLLGQKTPRAYFQAFLNNHWIGLMLFLGVVFSGV